jgi:hypothetical protein
MQSNTFSTLLRYGLCALGLGGLVLTFGLFTSASWATALIPWELSRLGAIFLASIAAASAFPILWLALTREYGAIAGGAINFSIMFAGFGGLAFVANANNPRTELVLFGIFCVAGLVSSLALLYYGLRQPIHDRRPMPRAVRISFMVFVVILTVVGSVLVLKVPNIFPFTLTPQQSVLYGWIFVGAATYFAYALYRPLWGNAEGQLLGFLAYDLLLILPFAALFFGTEPYNALSLVIYIAILIYSGALAIYFLFLNPSSRINLRAK